MSQGARIKLAFDHARESAAGRVYARTKAVEARFAIQLRRIARNVADLMAGFDLGRPDLANELERQLEEYARILDPWARSVSRRMIAEIASRDWKAWQEVSRRIGRGLAEEIAKAPTGAAMQALLNEQTALITSIPREAAERVRKLTLEGITGGKRPAAYVAEIMRTGEVSKSRATLIARTEVARTTATLTRVRAESIGSEGYLWRTTRDSDVRPSHKKMEGKYVAWNSPPTLDNLTGHAGCLPNCRCVSEVVIPESIFD